jgi:hypothetical protein
VFLVSFSEAIITIISFILLSCPHPTILILLRIPPNSLPIHMQDTKC